MKDTDFLDNALTLARKHATATLGGMTFSEEGLRAFCTELRAADQGAHRPAVSDWTWRVDSGAVVGQETAQVPRNGYLEVVAQELDIAVIVPTPEQVKAARVATGMSQRACAQVFGCGVLNWKRKEGDRSAKRKLSAGEFAYLQLLAGQHPQFELYVRDQALDAPAPQQPLGRTVA